MVENLKIWTSFILMKILLVVSILLLNNLVFADQGQREIEHEAIKLVIKKYGKGLENRLKGTGLNPSYRSWYESECFVSVAAGTHKEFTWSAIKWFGVNICSGSAEIIEIDRPKKNFSN